MSAAQLPRGEASPALGGQGSVQPVVRLAEGCHPHGDEP
jgi:hypothetical protein